MLNDIKKIIKKYRLPTASLPLEIHSRLKYIDKYLQNDWFTSFVSYPHFVDTLFWKHIEEYVLGGHHSVPDDDVINCQVKLGLMA